jgi:hypothetical protein
MWVVVGVRHEIVVVEAGIHLKELKNQPVEDYLGRAIFSYVIAASAFE